MNNMDRFDAKRFTSRFRREGTAPCVKQMPTVTCRKFSVLTAEGCQPWQAIFGRRGTRSSLQEVKQWKHEICDVRWMLAFEL